MPPHSAWQLKFLDSQDGWHTALPASQPFWHETQRLSGCAACASSAFSSALSPAKSGPQQSSRQVERTAAQILMAFPVKGRAWLLPGTPR
jgi:hypothetical protein